MKKIGTIGLFIAVFTLTAFYPGNKPKAEYMIGKVKITVWENEREGKFGKFTAKDFKVEKLYKKDGSWETTNYYNLTELLQLRAAIDKAISEEGFEVDTESDN